MSQTVTRLSKAYRKQFPPPKVKTVVPVQIVPPTYSASRGLVFAIATTPFVVVVLVLAGMNAVKEWQKATEAGASHYRMEQRRIADQMEDIKRLQQEIEKIQRERAYMLGLQEKKK